MHKKTTYAEKLLHPLWQKKRLEVLEDNDFTCQLCGDKESTLHVHHKMYAKGKEPWDYTLKQYTVLCWNCHKNEHQKDFDLFFEVMSRLPIDGPYNKEEVSCLVGGFVGMNLKPEFPLHEFLFLKGQELSNDYWKWLDEVGK
jgi:hypothetical protein